MTDWTHTLPSMRDLVDQPDAETRARRISAATILALQGLPDLGELRALDILLEATHQRLTEIQAMLVSARQ